MQANDSPEVQSSGTAIGRIERHQQYTHALLAATMGVVAGSTATLADSAIWAAFTVVLLAATLTFTYVWKTTPRSMPHIHR